MKRIISTIIMLLILTSISSYGQRTWFTPKQQKTLDSLDAAISALSLGSSALGTGKIFIGDNTGVAYPRTTSGDITLSTTGVFGISPLAIVNADISASAAINPSKIDGAGHTISTSEFGALDGVTANIQEQIDGFIVGTGFLATSGGTMTGDAIFEDDTRIYFGTSSNASAFYSSGNFGLSAGSGTDLILQAEGTDDINIQSNSSLIWTVSGTSGDLIPGTANTYSIGSYSKPIEELFVKQITFRPSLNANAPTGSRLSIPSFTAFPTGVNFGHGDMFSLSNDFYYNINGTFTLKKGFYLTDYYDEDPLDFAYIPDSTEIVDMLAKTLTSNAIANVINVEEDSVDFANKNTINKYINASVSGVTLYFKNYQAGISQQVIVYTQSAITLSPPSGVTLEYESGIPITYSSTGDYRIWFTYLSATKCLVDWGFYEAP